MASPTSSSVSRSGLMGGGGGGGGGGGSKSRKFMCAGEGAVIG